MADITNKNELKRRIELFLDELDYSINEDFCKETMKMMREFIGHASHRLDCEESRVKSLKSKLKNYKDLEEQGLLLRLPCKVGDIIYEIHPLTSRITPRKIKSIVVCNCPDLTIMYKSGYDYSNVQDDFGKTVFLTKEEAEHKLKEMENNNKVMNFNDKQVTVTMVGNSEDTAVNLIHKVMNGKL